MNGDPVLDSLEDVAAADVDIGVPAFDLWTRRRPEALNLMGHTDQVMRGRMMGDVLTLLMTPAADVDRGYLNFEVRSHRAYGVTADMFRPLLESVRDCVRETLGGGWSAATAAAWEQRINDLVTAIDDAHGDESAGA